MSIQRLAPFRSGPRGWFIIALVLWALLAPFGLAQASDRLIDADGKPALAESVKALSADTVAIDLKADAKLSDGSPLTADLVVGRIEGQVYLPVKVKKTDSGVEVKSEKGSDAILKMLKELELGTADGEDAWMAVASLDFAAEPDTAGSNIRSRRIKANAVVPLETQAPIEGEWRATVLDIKRGPFPSAYLHLWTDSPPPKGAETYPKGAFLAVPEIASRKGGGYALDDAVAVANLGGYFLRPDDVITAKIEGTRKEQGRTLWRLTDLRRVGTDAGDKRPPNSFVLISKAESAGEIDRETAIRYRVLALYDQSKLPESLSSTSPNRGATLFLHGLKRDWPGYSDKLKADLRPYLGALKLP